MACFKGVCLGALATALLHGASASAVQQPLFADEAQQAPIAPSSSASKPLVDSEALQKAISIDKLVQRSLDLYKIAELSLHEFNHPTRVIGSKGTQRHAICPAPLPSNR